MYSLGGGREGGREEGRKGGREGGRGGRNIKLVQILKIINLSKM